MGARAALQPAAHDAALSAMPLAILLASKFGLRPGRVWFQVECHYLGVVACWLHVQCVASASACTVDAHCTARLPATCSPARTTSCLSALGTGERLSSKTGRLHAGPAGSLLQPHCSSPHCVATLRCSSQQTSVSVNIDYWPRGKRASRRCVQCRGPCSAPAERRIGLHCCGRWCNAAGGRRSRTLRGPAAQQQQRRGGLQCCTAASAGALPLAAGAAGRRGGRQRSSGGHDGGGAAASAAACA